MRSVIKNNILKLILFAALSIIAVNIAYSFNQKIVKNEIEKLEFRTDELYVSQTNVPLEQVINQLTNRGAWQKFLMINKGSIVYLDPRSGRPASLITRIPIIPGTGDGNCITLEDVSMKLGYAVKEIHEQEVKQLVLGIMQENADVLRLSMDEIGEIRTNYAGQYLWQIFIRRAVRGIPVRDANVSLAVNHGNLVLWGLEKWGDIDVSIVPKLSIEEALGYGFSRIGGQTSNDTFSVAPHLELVPVNPLSYTGVVGAGYAYRLVWAYVFNREGYRNNWEVLVDAHNGAILAMQDTNQYALKKIVGAIYPVSNDECPPDGVSVSNMGMSFVNTGLLAPDNYTDFNGLFNWTSGAVTTTLDSKYITEGNDYCGVISENSTVGDLDLGGTAGQHDCAVPAGHSAGDTFSTRSTAYELNQINREARGWINNNCLDCNGMACMTANVNINTTCGAYYASNTINFNRSGGGCRNTGESASVFDHEWGHGLDYYDAAGSSNPGEVFSDIVSTIRLHQTCVGRGFFWTLSRGCGGWTCPTNPASTGFNCAQYGDCCVGCTGIRDSDYAKHASGAPHTPANFICVHCGAGAGPCGKEVHCENAPAAEAPWDLAARDLQSPPFNYDKQTAFQIAERTIYIGSGNVTNWYTCTCPSTSGGCANTNGYMQFITADDDDGNLTNGTPHMTAIYNAYDRHGIACATPPPQNSGCLSGPTIAPVLTVATISNGAQLSWNAVAGAANYRISKSTGMMGCDFGKILIATTNGTTYTDQAMDCAQNNYIVQPVGSNPACLGPVSNCVTVIPPYPAPSNITATASAPNEVTVNWDAVTGASGYNVYRQYTVCSAVTTERIASDLAPTVTTYIDSPVSGGHEYQYQLVTLSNLCGEGSKSNWVPVTPTGDCALMPCYAGATSVTDNKTASCALTLNWGTGTSSCSGSPILKYDVYKSTDPAFVPASTNLLISCQTGTSYVDANVNYGTTYYYIVRAEDSGTGGSGPCNGGNIDNNLNRKSGTPTGIPVISNLSWPFETGLNGWTVTGTWALSTARVNPGGSTHSVHSSQALNLQCDYFLSPVIQPSSAAVLTIPNWYDTEIFNGTYWYDRCNVWAVQGVTKTLLTPASGKLYSTGTYYNWSYCSMGINPGWCGAGTAQAWSYTTFNLSAYNGQNIQIEIRYMTDDITAGEGIYVDDISVTNALTPTSCITGYYDPPGYIHNSLKVTKSDRNPRLDWLPDYGLCCIFNRFAVYRGTLPWTGFNHEAIACDIPVTSLTYADNNAGFDYYYLVVQLNSDHEGSYGKQSTGLERPQGASPCRTNQNINPCDYISKIL